MHVEVIIGHTPRARIICDAMATGIRRCGDSVRESKEEFYNGPVGDVAVFYGLSGKLRDAFLAYRQAGLKAVYIDLGYWNRTEGGKLYGYHKIAVNSRHPTAYYSQRYHAKDRFAKLGVNIKPWNKGGTHILLAGMGAKAADVEGFKANEWEEAAVRELRRYTDRPIIYRPKPSWRGPIAIEGTLFSPAEQPLAEVLDNCHATVSHHSNVCVDGLLEGIPSFCFHGVATDMGHSNLSLIESPIYPDGRDMWAAHVAYTQWKPDEMQGGHAWHYLKDEGLV